MCVGGRCGRAPSFSTSLNHCLRALLLLGICHIPQVGWEGKWLRTTRSLTIFDKQVKPNTVRCKIRFKIFVFHYESSLQFRWRVYITLIFFFFFLEDGQTEPKVAMCLRSWRVNTDSRPHNLEAP